MGFADQFLQGLMAGRAEQERKRREAMIESERRMQGERQGRQDAQADALTKLKLWQSMPQPEQALPTGQAGPPAPLPVPEVEVPSLVPGAAPMRVPPTTMTDILTRNRAQQDLERTNKLEDLRATLGAQKEASSFTITPEQAARSGGMFQPGQTVTPQEASFGAGLYQAEENRKARYAAQVAEAARRGDAAKVLDFQKAFTRSASLRDDYRSTPAYKQYATVLPQVSIIESAGKNPTAASDLALVYSYVKILDPNSTVRESEFQTAAQAGAFGEKVKAAVGKAVSGTLLSADMRQDFVKAARQNFQSYKAQKQALDKAYAQLAEKSQVPADMVITPDVDFGMPGAETQARAPQMIGGYQVEVVD